MGVTISLATIRDHKRCALYVRCLKILKNNIVNKGNDYGV